MSKIKVNKKLFDIFSDANHLCVKDIYFDKDDHIFEKYSKICEKANDNCDECWVRFFKEDLFSIRKDIPTECGCEGSCPVCKTGEVVDHKCNNCKTEFCKKCHGVMFSIHTSLCQNVAPCLCNSKEKNNE